MLPAGGRLKEVRLTTPTTSVYVQIERAGTHIKLDEFG